MSGRARTFPSVARLACHGACTTLPRVKPPTVAILIPARNEAGNLPRVLAAIPTCWARVVVVIDNGSSDGTADVARGCGAVVLSEPIAGYGRACLRGLRWIQELRERPLVCCILDGDFADDPRRLEDLVAPILAGEAEFVLSTRTWGGAERGALTPLQRWGNAVQVAVLKRRFGLPITDMGPMRAIRTDRLLDLGMSDPTWGWNVEMAARAARAGLRIREVPVPYRNRHTGTSKIQGDPKAVLRVSARILWTLLRYAR